MKMLSRAVKIKYLLLVAITVFVIFGNLIFMQRVQHLKMDNAKIINLLGKEQLLLNKIGNQWVSWNNDSSKQDQILLDFAKLMKINTGLIDGDQDLGIYSMENLALKKKMLVLSDSLHLLQAILMRKNTHLLKIRPM